jgi:hypothetical protein
MGMADEVLGGAVSASRSRAAGRRRLAWLRRYIFDAETVMTTARPSVSAAGGAR